MKLSNKSRLEYEVMSRVRNVSALRLFIKSPISSGLLAAALIFFSSILVSLNDVLNNTMNYSSWSGRFSYASSSLMHTSWIVQIYALCILVACLMVCVNSLRKIGPRFYILSHAVVSAASFSSRFVFGKFLKF
jgi:hypothetical protein